MGLVVCAADCSDIKFWNGLQNLLCRGFDVTSRACGLLKTSGGGAALLLTDAAGLEEVCADDVIVIIKDAEQLACHIRSRRGVAVVDSGNASAVRLAGQTGLAAITYGLSPRDTVTLSSREEESAVIGLQRAVTCFDGTTAEPQEIPILLNAKTDSFALMCAAAVYILTGSVKKLYTIGKN